MSANPPLKLRDCLATQHARLNDALDGTPPAAGRNQYHRDLSPVDWHYAHCHFIEAVWLGERLPQQPPEAQRDWHDLYFPELSPKWRRGGRLPPRDRLRAWGNERQTLHREWLADPAIQDHPLMVGDYLAGFLAQHHAMHLETLEQVRWFARLHGAQPGQAPAPPRPGADTGTPVPDRDWIPFDAARHTVGYAGVDAFDNERGVHETTTGPFEIAARPVSNADHAAFIEQGGYRRPEFWDRAGLEWLRQSGTRGPLGWWRAWDGHWWQTRPDGEAPLDPDAPAMGLCWFAARAHARWAGARLPHEHEWERAAREGALQATGQVWEWCDNAFFPYPGFRAYPYEGFSVPWFDGEHRVLRGGCEWSDPILCRPSLRNFFTPEKRHVFAGLRLVRDR